ncbi:hypothetical protein KSP40_PGU022357 [Platanthera guangdongensis]|uniref:Uncharacterized protein n=1 Tax=Platanthera guangdongensis TaxID=2320717 RepID=A0ABR2MPS5_9ASPA
MSSLSLPWPFRGGAKHRLRRKEESASSSSSSSAAAHVEELGVTPQLLDFTKGFTVDTFKNFPIQVYSTANGDLDASSGSNPNDDLSEWQERHAMLLLARSKV